MRSAKNVLVFAAERVAMRVALFCVIEPEPSVRATVVKALLFGKKPFRWSHLAVLRVDNIGSVAESGGSEPVALRMMAVHQVLLAGGQMVSRKFQGSSNPFAAVWSGDYERAIGELYHETRSGAAVMRARIFGHLHLDARLVAEYESGICNALEPTERAIYLAIAACAHLAIGRSGDARAIFADAERAGTALADPLARATLGFYHVVFALRSGDEAATVERVRATLVDLDTMPDLEPRDSWRYERNHLRARLLAVRAILCGLRCDYAGEERALSEALLCCELVHNRDAVLEAELLAALAMHTKHFPSISSRELVFLKAQKFTWTSYVDRHRAMIKGALALNRVLFGGSIDAQALGGRSAPALATRVWPCVNDLAFTTWSDTRAYAEEVRFGLSLARASAWDTTLDDSASALLVLISVVAPNDLASARELLTMYDRAIAAIAPYVMTTQDARSLAARSFAVGCIAKAAGDDGVARAAFADSLAFWRGKGLRVRAAFGGIEAFAISRDARDLDQARAFVADFPEASYTRRLQAALTACMSTLPPRFPYFDRATG